MDNPLLETKFWVESRIISLIANGLLLFMLVTDSLNFYNSDFSWLVIVDIFLLFILFMTALIPLAEFFTKIEDSILSSRLMRLITLIEFLVLSVIQFLVKFKDVQYVTAGFFLLNLRYLFIKFFLVIGAYWKMVFEKS